MARSVTLARHGETEWSRDGKHTGRTDIPLTDRGREQARTLGRVLAEQSIDMVLTSPLERARDTCHLAGYGDSAVERAELREWDYGEFEGRTTLEIREEVPGWSIWTHPVQQGETLEQVGRRVDSIVEELEGVEGNVLLFAHGHVLRALAARWCGLRPMDGRLLALSTATVSELGWERETKVVRAWNVPATPAGDD